MSRWALPASVLLLAATAQAHGGPPRSRHVLFSQESAETFAVVGTFGIAVTRDGGESFEWICFEAVPGARIGVSPRATLTDEGALLVAASGGLARGEDLGCRWTAPEPELTRRYVADVVSDPTDGSVAYALESAPSTENRVFRSSDGGRTWSPLAGRFPMGFLPERIAVAPSDRSRIYVSGAYHATRADPARAVLFRSDDGGASYSEIPFALGAEERNFLIDEVDAASPDVVWARAVGELHERVVVTADGGESWRDLDRLSAVGAEVDRPFGLASAPDGTIWYGNAEDGLLVSPDGIATDFFDKELAVGCVQVHAGAIWLCGDGFADGYSVGRVDELEAIVPVLTLDEVHGIRACEGTTEVVSTCTAWWDDLLRDSGRSDEIPDGGTPIPDAGSGRADGGPDRRDGGATRDGGAASRDAARSDVTVGGGGGCSAAGHPAPTSWLALVVLCAAIARRRAVTAPSGAGPG